MRCKNCDYPLWNLRERRCPECGQPFLPSEFEFAANSVQFCCPNCDQAYYGTSDRGHLVPDEFDCVTCGRHMRMDDAILRPAAGLEEEQTQAEEMPWLERRSRGRIRSWFRTIGYGLARPVRLAQLTPTNSPVGQAWLYLSTLIVLSIVGNFLVVGLVIPLMFLGGSIAGAAAVATFVLVALGMPLLAAALWGLLAHGLIRLTGPHAAGLGRTYQAICYSSGPLVFMAIPCLGWQIGWFAWPWWAVSAALMTREAQRISTRRAAFAVAAPPLLLTASCLATWIGTVFWGFSTSLTAARSAALVSVEPTRISQGLLFFRQAHQSYPEHAVELVLGRYIAADELLLGDTATLADDVPIGQITLNDLSNPNADGRWVQANVDDMIEQTADRAVYRFGDFVFVYRGIDPINASPSRWVAIVSPDPEANPGPSVAFGPVVVLLSDGSIHEYTSAEFPAALQAENAVRQTLNLPPIPPPSTVLHVRPDPPDQ